MSAFVVSREHITALVQAGMPHNQRCLAWFDVDPASIEGDYTDTAGNFAPKTPIESVRC